MAKSRFILAALVGLTASLGVAQDPGAPDPIIQSINAELDRSANAPDRGEGAFEDSGRAVSSSTTALLRTIAALSIVVALLLAGGYALKRWGKGVPILAGPNLAKVLGRIYLDRGTALHFVRVADRVLVVGVNGSTISTVAEFNAAAFEGDRADSPEAPAGAFNPDSFLAELQEHSRELKQAAGLPRAEEDEIAALRGDIQRLQRYLRDENREQGD
jgi:flagellar biogenesis protein FliO